MTISIYIGRFQPFHVGHASVVSRALQQSDRMVMVLGNVNSPRTVSEPFSTVERAEIILAALSEEQRKRISLATLDDRADDLQWFYDLRTMLMNMLPTYADEKIVLVGHNKDATTSQYLKLLSREWPSVNIDMEHDVSATDIREALYAGEELSDHPGWFTGVDHIEAIKKAADTDSFREVAAMRAEASAYQDKWGKGPHLTCDSVVTRGDAILLVRRKNNPYAGKWALPGGFLNLGETFLQGALRELREETGVDIDEGFLTGTVVSDKARRDPRARVISVAHRFDLPVVLDVVPVAGDDAAESEWFNLNHVITLMKTELAFDHYDIIRKLMK